MNTRELVVVRTRTKPNYGPYAGHVQRELSRSEERLKCLNDRIAAMKGELTALSTQNATSGFVRQALRRARAALVDADALAQLEHQRLHDLQSPAWHKWIALPEESLGMVFGTGFLALMFSLGWIFEGDTAPILALPWAIGLAMFGNSLRLAFPKPTPASAALARSSAQAADTLETAMEDLHIAIDLSGRPVSSIEQCRREFRLNRHRREANPLVEALGFALCVTAALSSGAG